MTLGKISPIVIITRSGASNCDIVAPACDSGIKRDDKPKTISINLGIYFGKLDRLSLSNISLKLLFDNYFGLVDNWILILVKDLTYLQRKM